MADMANNVLWPEELGPRPEAVFTTLDEGELRQFEQLRELVARIRRLPHGYDLVLNALFADDALQGAGLALQMWLAATTDTDPRDLAAHCYGIDGRVLIVPFAESPHS